MSFDVNDLFEKLFETPCPVVPLAMPMRVEPAEQVTVEPIDPEAVELADDWTADTIDWPEPCAVCGSLKKWWDMIGRERCAVCEAETLARGLKILRPVNNDPRTAPVLRSRDPV